MERTGDQLVYDYNYKGGLDSQGKISDAWQEDALKNAIRMWIGSFSGDFIGNFSRGGRVMSYLAKPMDNANVKQFKHILRKSFQDEFGGIAKIDTLSITPLREERKWRIDMAVVSFPLKLKTEIQDYLRGQ